MLELSIWLGICDKIRRDRLKSRDQEWEEQGVEDTKEKPN
jgi:hypothetical protein